MTVRNLGEAAGDIGLAQAEICVIGAGMAGLFIARKLALAGRKVIVLESGKAGFDQETHDLNKIIDVRGHYTRSFNGRYRGLGGSSSQWGGRMIPIYEHDIQTRRYFSAEGWPVPFVDLDTRFKEIETVFDLPHGSYGADAIDGTDISGTFPVDDPDFSCRWPKWISFRQCNLANIWKRELERLPNLDIWLDATVVDFTLDSERGQLESVRAQNFKGRTLNVQAEQFVVAAGAIESTRLLLWLDARSNNRAFAGCRALGRYFQDHLKADVATISRQDQDLSNRLFGYHFVNGTRRSLHLDLTPAAQERDQSGSAFVYAAMDLSESRLERIKRVARGLQNRQTGFADIIGLAGDASLVAKSAYWRYIRRQIYMPSDVSLHVQIAIEQAPKWSNFIALAPERDRLGLPKAALNWQPSADDEHTFRSTALRLRNYWRRTGLDQRCQLVWADDANPTPFIDLAEAYAHPSGTTRMGLVPATSVVDPDMTCHAVPNLSVASASTFPTAGSANPTLTILAFALRLADKLSANKVPTASHQSPFGLAAASTILGGAAASAAQTLSSLPPP